MFSAEDSFSIRPPCSLDAARNGFDVSLWRFLFSSTRRNQIRKSMAVIKRKPLNERGSHADEFGNYHSKFSHRHVASGEF